MKGGLHEEHSRAGMGGFVDGELIEDFAMVSLLCDAMRLTDESRLCNRCQDESEPIAAILMLEADEKAWLLCGPCLRDLPREGLVD